MEANIIELCCADCRVKGNLFTFPCSEVLCYNCIIKFYYSEFLSLESRVNSDLSNIQEQSSFYGCKKYCESCKSSLNYSKILEFAENSDFSVEDKSNFIRLLKLFETYYNGQPTYFYICERCEKLKSSLNLNIFVCQECISELCFQQTGCTPIKVNYIDGRPKGTVNFNQLKSNEFCLLQLMDTLSIFDFVETHEEIIQIHKLQTINHKMEVLLIKPTLIPNAPQNDIRFKDLEDMHDLSSYKLYLT